MFKSHEIRLVVTKNIEEEAQEKLEEIKEAQKKGGEEKEDAQTGVHRLQSRTHVYVFLREQLNVVKRQKAGVEKERRRANRLNI